MDAALIFWIVVVVACIVGFAVMLNGTVTAEVEEKKRLQSVYEAYQASLKNLKAAPTNPSLKQEALRLGRAYSALTREQKAVTIYDEFALSNDINAATAGATVIQAVPPAASIEQRLR